MSSPCNDSFISSLLIWVPFIFLVWLLWLGRPVLCWIEVVRVGILVLFQVLVRRLSPFHHLVLCWLWVCQKWLVFCWDMFPLYPLWQEFCHKCMWNFIKCFFCIYWDDHVVFVSFLVMWCITLIDLKHPCDPGMNPAWSWCMILFLCCWIWFANILLRTFASMFIKDIGL